MEKYFCSNCEWEGTPVKIETPEDGPASWVYGCPSCGYPEVHPLEVEIG